MITTPLNALNVTRKYVLTSFAGSFHIFNIQAAETEWRDGEETPLSQNSAEMSGFSPHKE